MCYVCTNTDIQDSGVWCRARENLSDECKFLGEIHMQWVFPPVTLLAFVFPMGLGPLMSYISFYICDFLYSPMWAEWFKDFPKYCLSKFCSSRRGKRVREHMTKWHFVNVWLPEGNLSRVAEVGFVKVLFLEAWLWEQIRHNCQMILVSPLLQSVVFFPIHHEAMRSRVSRQTSSSLH